MDISKANTDPYYNLFKYREAFGTYLKITAVSILHLQNALENENGPELLKNLMNASPEPWQTPFPWKRFDTPLATAKEMVGEMGLVRIFSALDAFLEGCESEYSRWERVQANNGEDSEDEERSEKEDGGEDEKFTFSKLCKRHDWDEQPIQPLYPLLEYFQIARNCSAHRLGVASRAYREACKIKRVD